ncbi:MAG: indole-3-glycerol phosphate synthase TrpC [Acetobacteraceae bacterium]|nr:indole-3-glycerol phosphate synthase TrpC [Acetobacteraceae bacterium]MBV8524808.1 indole-3-glycerol phosphate synthase TrpC [Acetobacteraceae bacterium]MBV8591578.1 indole-3-glycerol phosphate synthase TrpC [Acetobacteraceae bacterium]
MADVLARICETTRAETARRKSQAGLSDLARAIREGRDAPRGFAAALGRQVARGRYGLIAEIKKASPSGGLIRPEFDPAGLARAYHEGGATCLSVLTDAAYFQGAPADLQAARRVTALPVLRKDFVLDPWQIYESRLIGADCILLILAALADTEAAELESAARELGMDVLAEVHDAAELERALRLPARLIGINNRNLKTLRTDLYVCERLAHMVPQDRILVAESGIRSPADIARLASAGARCFLVGESLMRQADVAQALRQLLSSTPEEGAA